MRIFQSPAAERKFQTHTRALAVSSESKCSVTHKDSAPVLLFSRASQPAAERVVRIHALREQRRGRGGVLLHANRGGHAVSPRLVSGYSYTLPERRVWVRGRDTLAYNNAALYTHTLGTLAGYTRTHARGPGAG